MTDQQRLAVMLWTEQPLNRANQTWFISDYDHSDMTKICGFVSAVTGKTDIIGARGEVSLDRSLKHRVGKDWDKVVDASSEWMVEAASRISDFNNLSRTDD